MTMPRVRSDGMHGHITCPHGRRQSRCNLCHPGRVCVPALLVHLEYLLADLTTKDSEFKSSHGAHQFVHWPRSGRLVALLCVAADVGPLCSIFPEVPPLPVGASLEPIVSMSPSPMACMSSWCVRRILIFRERELAQKEAWQMFAFHFAAGFDEIC